MTGASMPGSGRQNRLIVVRHGETQWSKLGKHTSRSDIALTPAGEEMARTIGPTLATFSFALVLSSPRLRACRTADLAGFGDRKVIDDDLAEWFYGDDESLTTPEIRVDRPNWTIWRDGPRNGESIGQVAARADRIIGRVDEADGDVLAFAHGHFLDVLVARWIGLDGSQGRCFTLDPATVSILSWHHEDRIIQQWNSPVRV